MAVSRARQTRDDTQAELPQRSAAPLRDSPDRQQRGTPRFKPRTQPSRLQARSCSPVSRSIADPTVDGTPGSKEGQSPASSTSCAELLHSMQSQSVQELEVRAICASQINGLGAEGERGAGTDAAMQQCPIRSPQLTKQQLPDLYGSMSSKRRQPLRDASLSSESTIKAAILQTCSSRQPVVALQPSPFKPSPYKQQRFTRPPKVRHEDGRHT